jgi:hypothetical protein
VEHKLARLIELRKLQTTTQLEIDQLVTGLSSIINPKKNGPRKLKSFTLLNCKKNGSRELGAFFAIVQK